MRNGLHWLPVGIALGIPQASFAQSDNVDGGAHPSDRYTQRGRAGREFSIGISYRAQQDDASKAR